MKAMIAAAKGIAGKFGIKINDSSNSDFIDHIGNQALSGLGVPSELLAGEKPKKNTRIRGKLLNRTQRKTLLNNGMTNEEIELFLILKTEFVQQGPSKRLNQSSKKAEKWTLMNRDTGELKEVYIG